MQGKVEHMLWVSNVVGNMIYPPTTWSLKIMYVRNSY